MRKKTARKSWKADANHKKTVKRTKLALLVLGLIILLLVLGKILAFIVNFQSPISKSSLPVRNYFWDGVSNLNLVIKGSTSALVSYDPQAKKIIIIDLPDSLLIQVPGGFGNWQVSSVYELGQVEKEQLGGKFLKTSVANFFALPVDGYIKLKKAIPPAKLVQDLKDGVLAYIKISDDLQTDLSYWEMLQFVWGISKVRFDKVEQIDLTKTTVLEKSKLPDGSLVYIADPDRIDTISAKMAEDKIVTEKVPIAIFNATKTPGLAQFGARIISNLGGNVIFSANANKLKEKTIIYTTYQNKFTLTRVKEVFASDCSNNLKCDIIVCEMSQKLEQSDRCFVDDSKISDSRASINVVLGEDFNKRN